MVDRPYIPSRPQLRLANALRRLREGTGETLDGVGEHLKWSRTKLSRLENAKSRISAKDTAALCAHYQADVDVTAALTALALDNRREWWRSYMDLFHGAFVGMEAEASVIHNFELDVVPGLLQIPDYVRAAIRAGRPNAGRLEMDRRVEARLKRQAVLDRDDPPILHAVLGETVLRRAAAEPDVGRKQLEHLVELAERSSVDIQVLPWAVGLHASMEGGFVSLTLDEDPPAVFTESAAGGLAMYEEPEDIDRFEMTFDNLRTQALDRRSSVEMIRQTARELL